MRSVILLLLFAIVLYAKPRPTNEDLQTCYNKVNSSQFLYKGNVAVALSKDLAAVLYDKNKKLNKKDYIKFDPYLGLYLVKVNTALNPTFMLDETTTNQSMWVNIVDKNPTQIGHIDTFGDKLGKFDTLSFSSDKTGMLICDCCSMIGIGVGGNKFVPNRYLKHFMAYNDVYYGDIGTVFEDVNSTLRVKSTKIKQLRAGDIVLSVNSKKPSSLRELNEAILFSPKNSTLNLEIMRSNKRLNLKIKVAWLNALSKPKIPKKDDFDLMDKNSFMYKFGIFVDKTMTIKNIKPNSKASEVGLKIGDKIIQIDRKDVKSPADLERVIASRRGKFYFLISRSDFQFFIRVYR